MQSTAATLKMGGLGANIGGDDWEKARKKQEQAQEYARQIRLQNIASSALKPPSKKKDEPKEMSNRDKAREFSKKIPKPKVRRQDDQ